MQAFKYGSRKSSSRGTSYGTSHGKQLRLLPTWQAEELIPESMYRYQFGTDDHKALMAKETLKALESDELGELEELVL